MSDCFDHAQDAWDSQEREFDEGCTPNFSNRVNDIKKTKIDKILYETPQAYLLKIAEQDIKFWVPKSWIEELNIKEGYVNTYRKFKAKPLPHDGN